jgi:hypothetical protein
MKLKSLADDLGRKMISDDFLTEWSSIFMQNSS